MTDPRRRLEDLVLGGAQSRVACEALIALGLSSSIGAVAAWASDSDGDYWGRWDAIEALERLATREVREALLSVAGEYDDVGSRGLAERALVALEGNLDTTVRTRIEGMLAVHPDRFSLSHLAARRVLQADGPAPLKNEAELVARWRRVVDRIDLIERSSIERDLLALWNDAADQALREPAFQDEYELVEPGYGDVVAPHYEHCSTGVTFAQVPALAFDMGSPENEAGRDRDEHVHRVLIRPFLLARTPLTRGQLSKLGLPQKDADGQTDDHPAGGLTWEQAAGVCWGRWAMPTEAQWEGACRAGTSGPFAGTGDPYSMGWFRENAEGRPQPVALKRPNEFGIYDMHGNVMEWCADVYDASFYASRQATGVDPLCCRGTGYRVRRGGSFYFAARLGRSASRAGIDPLNSGRYRGFRPARPLL